MESKIAKVKTYLEKGNYINDMKAVELCQSYRLGEIVEKIAEPSLANCQKKLIYCNECEGLYKLVLDNQDIKSIVTKEQFNSIAYKLEE